MRHVDALNPVHLSPPASRPAHMIRRPARLDLEEEEVFQRLRMAIAELEDRPRTERGTVFLTSWRHVGYLCELGKDCRALVLPISATEKAVREIRALRYEQFIASIVIGWLSVWRLRQAPSGMNPVFPASEASLSLHESRSGKLI